MVVDVAATVPDGMVLTAAAEVATSTSNTSGDTTASADLAVTAEAGVSLAQAAPGSMTAGDPAVYTFTVQNQGPSDAAGVSIAGVLDAELTFASATGATCSVDGSNRVACDVGTVADEETATVELTVEVASGTPEGAQIDVAAALTTATANTSPDTTAVATGPPVSTSADLSVLNIPLGNSAVVPGTTFAYRLRVADNGPSDAANAVITDQLPRALAFVSSPHDCTGDTGVYGAVVTCRAGATLPAGASASFTIIVRLHPALPGTGARVFNRATVSSDTPDPVSANNTRAARLPTGAAAAPRADLSIVKTLDATDPVTPGDTFTYSFTIANAGPSNAGGLTFTDTLPDALDWVEIVTPGSACEIDGKSAECSTTRSIPVGFTRTLTAKVVLDPSYTGDGSDLVSAGTITSATADPQPGNNTTTADAVPVDEPSGDLMLTQGFAAFPGSTIVPGQTTDNLLSLNNYGVSTATNVVVTHQLPPELAFVSSFDGCTGHLPDGRPARTG
jgi:uncharacterized repeat protein (TIGR01451 family)